MQGGGSAAPRRGRYESQKRRAWHSFGQYLRSQRPPLEPARCNGAHVLDFLRYLDQFGRTKVHAPAPCPCPLRQAWGSLDALVGRLCAAFDEHGGLPEANPFRARAVPLYRTKKTTVVGPANKTHVSTVPDPATAQ